MHAVIAWLLAGVAAACGLGAAALAVRRARSGRAPRFDVVPAVPYCRVRSAAAVAVAWRASGLQVIVRRGVMHVRTPDGARADVVLPASRELGEEPFAIHTHHAALVHDLAVLASRELGPMVCRIDGYVHGFDLDPDDEPDVARRYTRPNTDDLATHAMPVRPARGAR